MMRVCTLMAANGLMAGISVAFAGNTTGTVEAAHRKAGTVTKEIEVTEGEPAKVELTLAVK
jgi:hypothetical protein